MWDGSLVRTQLFFVDGDGTGISQAFSRLWMISTALGTQKLVSIPSSDVYHAACRFLMDAEYCLWLLHLSNPTLIMVRQLRGSYPMEEGGCFSWTKAGRIFTLEFVATTPSHALVHSMTAVVAMISTGQSPPLFSPHPVV